MNKKKSFVIFDSTQITLFVTEERGGIECLVYGASNFYKGVNKNFFVAPNEIESVIADLVNRYISFSTKKTGTITLVLPQHFFRLQTDIQSVAIDTNVTEKNIEELFNKKPRVNSEDVHVTDLFGGYSINEQDSFYSDVVGKEATSCQKLSIVIGLHKNVSELFNNISKNLKIHFRFCPPCIPIAKKIARDGIERGVYLKMNQLSSELVYFENNLPISATGLSLGGIHYADILMKKFSIGIDEATELLHHVNLGYALNVGEYVVFTGDKRTVYPIDTVNTALIELTEFWSDEIMSALSSLIGKSNLPVYLLGSNVMQIHGFAEILTKKTGHTFYTLSPDFSLWNDPESFLACSIFE